MTARSRFQATRCSKGWPVCIHTSIRSRYRSWTIRRIWMSSHANWKSFYTGGLTRTDSCCAGTAFTPGEGAWMKPGATSRYLNFCSKWLAAHISLGGLCSKERVMAILTIPIENRTINEPAAIAGYLAGIGVEYEIWKPAAEVAADAPAEEILAAYSTEIEKLKESGGYVTADVIDVKPQ